MASNFKALPEENMRGAPENRDMPLPLLDLSDAAVKELMRSAKKRGYVTVDQIGSVLPSKEANPAQIKDILSTFREMGVEEAETREAEPEEGVATREEPEGEGENDLVEVQQRPVPAKSGAKEPAERTDDPVRMYLREMSLVELLSREGEIAIAKRVEAGREAMIAGLPRARSPSRPLSSGGTSSTRARSSCATSSTSKQPMPALTPRPRRRR
jgi:RNA polymerase primary sigma factor